MFYFLKILRRCRSLFAGSFLVAQCDTTVVESEKFFPALKNFTIRTLILEPMKYDSDFILKRATEGIPISKPWRSNCRVVKAH